jgi:hypothetical protein
MNNERALEAGTAATPDGNGTQIRTGLPVPNAPLSAVIAASTTPCRSASAGRRNRCRFRRQADLMLGVNDSIVIDSAGAFSVVIKKQ